MDHNKCNCNFGHRILGQHAEGCSTKTEKEPISSRTKVVGEIIGLEELKHASLLVGLAIEQATNVKRVVDNLIARLEKVLGVQGPTTPQPLCWCGFPKGEHLQSELEWGPGSECECKNPATGNTHRIFTASNGWRRTACSAFHERKPFSDVKTGT